MKIYQLDKIHKKHRPPMVVYKEGQHFDLILEWGSNVRTERFNLAEFDEILQDIKRVYNNDNGDY